MIGDPGSPAYRDSFSGRPLGTLEAMCGRYATSRSSADISSLFDAVDETEEALVPDYNVAPTDPVPVVRVTERIGDATPGGRGATGGGIGAPAGRGGGTSVVSLARWGLVPPWAKDPRVGARMINARAETLAGSSAYARPFAKRRCLVPADGWYEWRGRGTGKQAYFMTPADGSVLAFAGLWTAWSAPGSTGRLLTFSVVTTVATGDLALVHDRMPLLLPPVRWSSWLRGVPGEDLLAPTPEEYVAGLEIRPVGPAVGDVRNDGPSLTARVLALPLTVPVESPLF